MAAPAVSTSTPRPTISPTPTQRRSARRTIYSNSYVPAYLRNSRAERLALRQDERIGHEILKYIETWPI